MTSADLLTIPVTYIVMFGIPWFALLIVLGAILMFVLYARPASDGVASDGDSPRPHGRS